MAPVPPPVPPAGPAALEVEGLSVSYGKFLAVESVTLSVRAGECVAVIGPNGHGKSSMVTAVAGLVRRGGVVRVFGRTLPAAAPEPPSGRAWSSSPSAATCTRT